jgi:opacity protein-like surface antigen
MIRTFIKIAFVLVPCSIFAQENSTKMSTYITPYGGLTLQGVYNTAQTGTAHKRGSYNEFDTDFDLQVKVKGESKSSIGYTYGFSYGSIWNKEGRKLNPGFEIDIFQNNVSHTSKLSNPNTEEVTNLVGPNADSVHSFVEEHYGAGHHKFSNSMTMKSWNAAANLTLSYDFSPKFSIHGGLGIGFTALTLKEAESLQSSPAPAVPGYETTSDDDNGIVNHFNSQPNASNNLMFGQFRLGTKIQLVQNIALRIDARGMYTGESEFTFGSTKYSDHAPTDNWMYTIDGGVTYTFTLGLCVYLK